MESQNSASAAMVAIKTEYDADTDDEAVTTAADKNTASCVASIVAVKKEYEADTDEEEAVSSAENKNSVSGAAAMVAVKKEYNADTEEVASMVAVKTEYNADTDSDEKAAANNNNASNVASMVAVKTEYDADIDDEAVLSAADKNNSLGATSVVAVKNECGADTHSDEENQPPIKKAKRADNEQEKYAAKIGEIFGQLLSLGRRDGAMLKQVHRISHDLKSVSSELRKYSNLFNSILKVMAAKKECDADTDSDEQKLQPIKKGMKGLRDGEEQNNTWQRFEKSLISCYLSVDMMVLR